MTTRIGDLTFGLDRHAWGMLSILSTLEPDFADFDEGIQMYDVNILTGVHREGNKNWASLALFPKLEPTGPRKLIAFGRDSCADEIVIESWRTTESAEIDETTPSTLRRFASKDLMEAVGFVRNELSCAYSKLRVGVLSRPEELRARTR